MGEIAKKAQKWLRLRVHPTMIPKIHDTKSDGVYESVSVVGDLLESQCIMGLGLGGDATASAVIADM